MSKILNKIPLKSETAANHLNTLQRAHETVSSWPEWKRSVIFREKSRVQTAEVSEVENEPLKERSA